MTSPQQPNASEREGQGRADDRADSTRKTPNTDMQAQEQTTEESAQPDARATGGGTPAESAMKQQSKTDAEAGR